MQLVGNQAFSRAVVSPRGLCNVVVKQRSAGSQEGARRNENSTGEGIGNRGDSFNQSPWGCVWRVELEHNREEGPPTWEDLAANEWKEYTSLP